MTILEAWKKANTGQTIENKAKITKTIKKEVGEYIEHLRGKLMELTLNEIFSNNWEIKKEKKTGWINIYKFKNDSCIKSSNGYYIGSRIANTKEESKKYGTELKKEFIATIKIEWEES
jgi:hypothetical protein